MQHRATLLGSVATCCAGTGQTNATCCSMLDYFTRSVDKRPGHDVWPILFWTPEDAIFDQKSSCLTSFMSNGAAFDTFLSFSVPPLVFLVSDELDSSEIARNSSTSFVLFAILRKRTHHASGALNWKIRMLRCNNVARRWSNECNTKQHPRLQRNVACCTKVWRKSNFIQHHATSCNIVQQGGQTDATCCMQKCCTMLHEMLHPFDRGFTIVTRISWFIEQSILHFSDHSLKNVSQCILW